MAFSLKTLGLCLLASPTWAMNYYNEPYRPQFHFSPAKNWINDPVGLLHHDGIYHLYYQYNPGGIEWGNMSWGHATSDDLTHWKEHAMALPARGFPDNVTEMIFTGSAIADVHNKSGFGVEGKTPLVAVYTSTVSYLPQKWAGLCDANELTGLVPISINSPRNCPAVNKSKPISNRSQLLIVWTMV